MKLIPYFDFSAKADPVYFASIFEQRSSHSNIKAGSYYKLTPQEILVEARKSNWVVDRDALVSPGKVCYKTRLPGYFGMAKTIDLTEDARICVIKPKPTDKYVCLGIKINRAPMEVKTTRLIVAMNPDGTGFILTLFPGRDIAPNLVYTDKLREGQVISREQALMLGITYVKLL